MRWKRVAAVLLAALLCLPMAGCDMTGGGTLYKTPYFGTELSEWNPLVIYAQTDEERCFARDPSLISMVTALFDDMQLEEQPDAGEPTGVRFTVATMRGMVELGRSDGKNVWRCGRRYTVKKDAEEELNRLFGLIRAETEGITAVTQEQLLAVTPEMTYRELLDWLGQTLQTAVVGAENAFLYQYDGEPFYITFENENDSVGVDGRRLIQDIGKEYHLADLLTEPEPLPGGRGGAYEAAFRLCAQQEGLDAADCGVEAVGLPFTDEQEQAQLETAFPGGDGAPVLRVDAYYYMAEDEMWLQVSCGDTARAVMVKKSGGAWSAALLV